MAYRVAATNPRRDYDFRFEREALDAIGAEIVPIHVTDPAEFIAAVADMDAIIPGPRVRLTGEIIRALRNVKVIAAGGIGVDGIDVEAATEAGILVTNVPDVFVEEVADHTFMLLLAVNRKLLYLHELATSNRWPQAHTSLGSVPKLYGKTLGLIAFGNIARAVARRALAFGLRVCAYDPYVEKEVALGLGCELHSLDDLLRAADIVSVHAPLTRGTYHLLSDAQFALMKPSAILINTGRGAVVDEPALIRALESGQIAGAGLDVLEQEPPEPNNPLLKMKNVVVTPHIASYSNEGNVDRRRRVGQEIAAVLTGRRPRNTVNPAVYERGWAASLAR